MSLTCLSKAEKCKEDFWEKFIASLEDSYEPGGYNSFITCSNTYYKLNGFTPDADVKPEWFKPWLERVFVFISGVWESCESFGELKDKLHHAIIDSGGFASWDEDELMQTGCDPWCESCQGCKCGQCGTCTCYESICCLTFSLTILEFQL